MDDSAAQAQQSVFGRPKEPPVVIFSANGKVRKFTINPLTFALGGAILFTFIVGYFAATAYLILRDDLIGASISRNARMQHSYEDRIAALRTQIDRITSRQLIEQQAMETRVAELLQRQAALGERHGLVTAALGQATGTAIASPPPLEVPIPSARPEIGIDTGIVTGSVPPDTGSAAALDDDKTPPSASKRLRLGALAGTSSPFTALLGKQDGADSQLLTSYMPRNETIFEIESSLRDVERQQISTLKKLRAEADQKTKKIASVLHKTGVAVPRKLLADRASNTGGPIIELKGAENFSNQFAALDQSLARLDRARGLISKVPLGSPMPGQKMSSHFGSRIDPILKRPAMHSGVDYRAPYGHPVRATAAGVVIHAKRNGGYGRMVEIDHGNGLTSRYAHLSRVKVRLGQRVEAGGVVGKVGSSGRSTGPHLHYEVRRNGQARNPTSFVRAKRQLKALL